MYRVIEYFTDLQDDCREYKAGDLFPREGLTVSEDRIKELSGNDNKQRRPLIALAEKPKKKASKKSEKAGDPE